MRFARLRRYLVGLLEGPRVQVPPPPCLFGEEHEFDPWFPTAVDCAGLVLVVQQRACTLCGLLERTPIHDPARVVSR